MEKKCRGLVNDWELCQKDAEFMVELEHDVQGYIVEYFCLEHALSCVESWMRLWRKDEHLIVTPIHD
jgi:uncharacterized protein YuzB (UPF0349 family)